MDLGNVCCAYSSSSSSFVLFLYFWNCVAAGNKNGCPCLERLFYIVL